MTLLDLALIRLIIFGDFGVLTNTPWKDRQPLAMLPGRCEHLAALKRQYPLEYAVFGNKGGVPFGLQSEDEAREELRWTAEQIGAKAFAVSFAHPTPKSGFERYASPELLALRKPAPGMILQLKEQLGLPANQILVVGDTEDRRAALAAGCAWQWHKEFFAPARPDVPVDLLVEDFDPFLDAEEAGE